MEPLNIESIRDEHENNMKQMDSFIDHVDTAELFNLIDEFLDISFRADYLRILHGVYVPKPRREQIYQEIYILFERHKGLVMKKGRFSKTEISYIKLHHEKISVADIASHLDRDPESIENYIREKLGDSKIKKKRTRSSL